jgi:hypothetical protein
MLPPTSTITRANAVNVPIRACPIPQRLLLDTTLNRTVLD